MVTRLDQLRVLVVEDEFLLADDLSRALAREGASVVGPVATAAGAQALVAEGGVDCAVLDINLRGELAYPLARELKERAIPFVFVTGYDGAEPAEALGEAPLLQKPVSAQDVIAAVGRLRVN
jgi:two-component system, response regulator PdtaR